MKQTRRIFVKNASMLAFAGFVNNCTSKSLAIQNDIAIADDIDLPNDIDANDTKFAYGPLLRIPYSLLDLPEGFSYKVISVLGEMMDDGLRVPDRADGMGCFALEGSKVALVRNHEIFSKEQDEETLALKLLFSDVAYDLSDTGEPLPGGTTTIIYDLATGKKTNEYRSLIGTATNCAGGVTPWGSWLTCEEDVRKAGDNAQLDHGWVFEVPSQLKKLSKPEPLKAMGRFNHEAAAVDPKTGIVYLTEDRPNSLFYRFIPNVYGDLQKGGRLQALGLKGEAKGLDSRNWENTTFEPTSWRDVRWIDLEDTDSPNDDLRIRGHNDGGVIFARGEGIHWGDGELYFCCTSGGKKTLGQIMRYVPSDHEGTDQENDMPGQLQLFFESTDINSFNYGDNLTVAPNGHLLVCEDQYTAVVNNYIRGITPDGTPYPFAKLNVQSETAGACFSPDGSTLFVNIQEPTTTLAITGPWDSFSNG